MKHFAIGAVIVAALSFALWVTWGREAVRITAGQPDQPAAVEDCVLFWFGAYSPDKAPDLRDRCRPHQPRSRT